MQDEFELVSQGFADYLDGNESYSSRYLMGMMFASGDIKLTHLSGNESFLAEVADKVKQFFGWLWSQFKRLFDFFGDSKAAYSKAMTEHKSSFEADAGKCKLKDNAAKEAGEALKRIAKALDQQINTYCNMFKAVLSEQHNYTEEARKALRGYEYKTIEQVKSEWSKTKTSLDGFVEKVESATDVKQLGHAIQSFGEPLYRFNEWFNRHIPRHKCELTGDKVQGVSKDDYLAAISKDMESVEENQQKNGMKLLQKLANFAVPVLNSNNTQLNNYVGLVGKMNSRHFWE